MGITRRELLALGLLGGGAVMLPLEQRVSARTAPRLPQRELPEPFTTPFARPPVLAPSHSDATTDYYELTLREDSVEIIPGYQTRIWGYEGIFPGPTIEANKGRPAVVRHINDLPGSHPTLGYEPVTSLHLHGSASLPQYDGYASDITARRHWKDYQFPNIQDARTLWYHDHGVHQTAPNVYQGLAGMYVLHDDLELGLDIPHGDYDVPLVVSDAMFSTTGDFYWNDTEEKGVFGDVILVNGRPWPTMQVERRKYRFRILNASITRSYEWQLSGRSSFTVIGTDAGLMERPQTVRRFRHSSAERYEVVIDFADHDIGDRVVLRNRAPKNTDSYADTDKVMAFDVVSEPSSLEGNTVPPVLHPDNPVMALRNSDASARRVLDLVRTGGEWTINRQTWADVIDSGYTLSFANPELDAVERWEFRNDSGGWHHPMHIHLVDFRILKRSVDGGRWKNPKRFERGPKDTVYVGENERVRVAARFGPHEGRYMVHCHNLVHEDHDMMVQYEVGSNGPDPMTTDPARPLPAPGW